MDIAEAVNSRKSIRAFKPDPVPQAILKEILQSAIRAPSWSNTQPWEFAIVTGDKLEEIRQGCIAKAKEEPNPDVARPEGYPEPYDSRSRALGIGLFEIKGIRREDKERRAQWLLEGLRHFESPCVIYVYTDRAFYFQTGGINVWPVCDCGIVAQNIMLLATRYGLGTIAQVQSVLHPDVLKKVLGIPDSKLMVLTVAIGYPDWDDQVNHFTSEREPLDSVAGWYGFDSK